MEKHAECHEHTTNLLDAAEEASESGVSLAAQLRSRPSGKPRERYPAIVQCVMRDLGSAAGRSILIEKDLALPVGHYSSDQVLFGAPFRQNSVPDDRLGDIIN